MSISFFISLCIVEYHKPTLNEKNIKKQIVLLRLQAVVETSPTESYEEWFSSFQSYWLGELCEWLSSVSVLSLVKGQAPTVYSLNFKRPAQNKVLKFFLWSSSTYLNASRFLHNSNFGEKSILYFAF